MNPEVLIIGCGFLGEAAADLFSTRGKRVLGLVKNHDSMRAFEGKSFDSATCDITSPADVDSMTDRLKGVELAIYSVSSGGAGAEAYAVLYREGLRRVLTAWRPQRVLFVSSTSVYAQTDGDWVTEESPTQPERGHRKNPTRSRRDRIELRRIGFKTFRHLWTGSLRFAQKVSVWGGGARKRW